MYRYSNPSTKVVLFSFLRWDGVGSRSEATFQISVLNSFVCSFFGEKGQIKHPRVILLLFFSPGLVHGTSFPLALSVKSCCSTAVWQLFWFLILSDIQNRSQKSMVPSSVQRNSNSSYWCHKSTHANKWQQPRSNHRCSRRRRHYFWNTTVTNRRDWLHINTYSLYCTQWQR